MDGHQIHEPDYGAAQKKFSLYLIGFIFCVILTLLSFGAVMSQSLTKLQIYAVIFSSAAIQFLVQVIFFLRLTTATEQGRTNVMTLLFTGVILVSILVGSLWIMWNLSYYMAH